MNLQIRRQEIQQGNRSDLKIKSRRFKSEEDSGANSVSSCFTIGKAVTFRMGHGQSCLEIGGEGEGTVLIFAAKEVTPVDSLLGYLLGF